MTVHSVTRRPTIGPSENAPPAREFAASVAFPQRVAGDGFEVEHRAADGQDHPCGDEEAEAGREAAEQRASGEHEQASLERPAPSHPVGRRPGEHQQAREHERIRVDGPCRPETAARRLCPIAGSATLTIVMSRETTNRPRQQIPRMPYRRRAEFGGPATRPPRLLSAWAGMGSSSSFGLGRGTGRR